VSSYQTRRCSAAACGLRFPVAEGLTLGDRCPHCGAATDREGDLYQTHGARELEGDPPPTGPVLEVLLDNVRSLRNVGAIFRSADGVGVRHIHLGGFTPTPAHPKMAKTALGAEKSVPWTHHPDGALAAERLLSAGHRLWALEGGPRASSLFAAPTPPASAPLVLVLGHEVSGVDPRILDLCEAVVRLPMIGHKGSLNVAVAFGVAAYALRYELRAPAPR
jgi:23S rRNA (guanosine2251-2'-O)-methyltransferase